jgi:hypothetical protein
MARIFNCEPLGTKMAQEILDDYMRLKIQEGIDLYKQVRVGKTIDWEFVVWYLNPDSGSLD